MRCTQIGVGCVSSWMVGLLVGAWWRFKGLWVDIKSWGVESDGWVSFSFSEFLMVGSVGLLHSI